MKSGKSLDKFLTEALAIEAHEAKEAGAIGYMARSLVQATMPHKQAKGTAFTRKNGAFTLSIATAIEGGLPFGSIPRLLIAWISTEAVKTKNRELILGDSLSDFMRELDLVPTGGRWGSITRLKTQTTRLFGCYISCTYTDNELTTGRNLLIADDYKLWWHPKDPNQTALFESTMTLSQRFYDELIQNPVPIDLRALKVLKRSPMALDVYCWLTYRMSYLRRPTVIPWEALQMQFGADYVRTRDFKSAFLEHLRKVVTIYPKANIFDKDNGLLLRPSPTHIPFSTKSC